MRSVPVLTAVIIGAVAVISGCGQQHPGISAGGGVAASPAASSASSPPSSPASPPPSSPGGNVAAAACVGRPATRGRLTLTNADSGQSFCVKTGTNVVVYLKGSMAHKWSPILANSSILKPSANGALMLALGVTGASFMAAAPGTAFVESSRPVCGPGDSAASAGMLVCDAIINFRVSVTVVR